ncbi:MAG: type I-F CRISPR-associated endonuclease Cas1f [Granulosicoccaceae bacterium]
MEDLSPSDLKSILHSKRANLYYLQHCRVLVNSGRVEYVTDEGNRVLYWNIPIANTTSILLGTGTSVTQAAMRELAKAGVLVGFCGGGGTPLFAGMDVQWLLPQSEYRPTEYLQQWVSLWFDDEKRLQSAIEFQRVRLAQIRIHWLKLAANRDEIFNVDRGQLDSLLNSCEQALLKCRSSNDVLTQEAQMTKRLYKLACQSVDYGEFTRAKNGSGIDFANRFLDHGNYLAYGLGATATWVLGIPHGFAILHGKTRRGGLVFDVADLVKDALILPRAFIAVMAGDDEQNFRQRCITSFRKADALDVMIDTLKSVAQKQSITRP